MPTDSTNTSAAAAETSTPDASNKASPPRRSNIRAIRPTSMFAWTIWTLGVHGPGISRAQKNVLQVLAVHSNGEGYCFPGEALLAVEVGIARESVSRAIRALIKNGLLLAAQTRHDRSGRFARNDYYLQWRYFEPIAPPKKEKKEKKKSPCDLTSHGPCDLTSHGEGSAQFSQANESTALEANPAESDRVISRHTNPPVLDLPSRSELSSERPHAKEGDEDAAAQRVQHPIIPPKIEGIAKPKVISSRHEVRARKW